MTIFFCESCKKVSTSKKGGARPTKRIITTVADKYGVILTPFDWLKQYDVEEYRLPNGRPRKRRRCPYCSSADYMLVVKVGKAADGGAEEKRLAFVANYINQQADKQSRLAKLSEESFERASNIEVGDFLSELASAIRYRAKAGQTEGDWIEEPERAYTDGRVFAEEITVASSVRLQLTLTLDTSASMWNYYSAFGGSVMRFAGPAFMSIDRVIRKAIQDLPEGAVKYETFIFHTSSYRLPAAFVGSYVGSGEKDGQVLRPLYPTYNQLVAAKKHKQIPETAVAEDWLLSGSCTFVTPLFEQIKKWEETEGNTDGVCLDIVLTDGELGPYDVAKASEIQASRSGRLRTVFLNFLPFNMWSNVQLPDRSAQFQVTPDNLDTSIRNILGEAIQDLLS
jgi:hypothetical protein